MKAPQEIDLKEDGIFTLHKKITSAEDLIDDISVIKTRKEGLLAITRHYENGWFVYVKTDEKMMKKTEKKINEIVTGILVDSLWNILGKHYGYNHNTQPQEILTKIENEITEGIIELLKGKK